MVAGVANNGIEYICQAKSKGMVVIPYVEGVTERLSRIYKKHRFSTGMKPHRTLHNMLVHPKDKRDPSQRAEEITRFSARTTLNHTLARPAVYLERDFLNTKQKLIN